jgi:putative ABC transport system permease protein
MLAAVFGVLLVACVNVANLNLARAAERIPEVAVRRALGASRGRVIRQLLVEGLLPAAAGALLGGLFARIGTNIIDRAIATDVGAQFWIDVRVDAVVLLFVSAMTVIAAVASSLVPALRVTRGTLETTLRSESRSGGHLRVGRFSRALVVAQIALSFGLLMGSGLMIKSIANISLARLPFRTDVLAARLDLTGAAYQDEPGRRQVLQRIRARVAELPGIHESAFASGLPGLAGQNVISIEGETPAPDAPARFSEVLAVSPDFFAVMQVRAIQGHALRREDRAGAEQVALVTEGFVRQFLDGRSPLGRRLRIGRDTGTNVWHTVVGVLPDLALLARESGRKASVVVPLDQYLPRGLDLLVTSTGDPLAPASAIRRAVAGIDSTIVIDRIGTVQGRFDQQTWGHRTFGGLFSTFGAAALLLASAGLYGVMAFAVRRRTAEIGIRMALGADPRRILRMVLVQGASLLAIGMTLGAALGLLLATQLTQLLFHVQPWDAPVFATTFLVLGIAGLAASLVPARRAAAVDPLTALRSE